ncbi:GrpB family protein [Aquimarina sp. SS2-1]|uniref:GrpB family protein n=1 Tax=Aquimarina besae TaxID=3342247 RepID=UPI00366DBA79
MKDHLLIQDYQPKWRTQFLSIKKLLEGTLFGLDLYIEHVGSTSVPGLAAKPIIDIDLVYKNTLDFKIIKDKLSQIGYSHKGNQEIPDREVFKRNNITQNKTLDTIIHHLYVCPHHSKELHRHILFRNHLRKHKDARAKYENLKREIADKAHQHKKTYADLKETLAKEFINSIIELEKKLQL